MVAIAVLYQPPQKVDEPRQASVAVLPFDDISADTSYERYADGITEVLIHQLSQVRNLRVIARTSSFAFRDSNTDVRTIGEVLNVEAVLEGSVQMSEGRLRISAQLIDTRTGIHYWSKLYDRDDTDIFAVQDEIAASVVSALSITLLNREERPGSASVGTNNFAAYEHYLKGVRQLNDATHESLPRAASNFERAIEFDENYIPARLALADTYEEMNHVGMMTYTESSRRGDAIAREILRLEPESIEAKVRVARKDFALNFPTGSGEAARLFQEIDEAAPGDPRTTRELAYFMKWNDRQDEALSRLEQAIKVDPLGRELLAAASALGALQYAGRLRSDFPNSPSGWSSEAEVRLAQGQFAEAFRLFQIAEDKDVQNPEFPAWQAMGDLNLAKEIVVDAQRYFDNSSDQFRRTETNYGLQLLSGDYDGALDTLEAELVTNKADDPISYVSLDLAYFWWLKFPVPHDAAFRDVIRLQAIRTRHTEKLNGERKVILELIGEN